MYGEAVSAPPGVIVPTVGNVRLAMPDGAVAVAVTLKEPAPGDGL